MLENQACLLVGVKPIDYQSKVWNKENLIMTCCKKGEHWGSFLKKCLTDSKIKEVLREGHGLPW